MVRSRRSRERARRGTSAVEAAIVYPLTMLLLLGTVILGLGVFRYQQIQSLACEGARYASVHGPGYAAANPQMGYATSQSVQGYIEGGNPQGQNLAVGLETSNLTFTVTWNPNPPTTTTPSTVSVEVTYTWAPEGYFKTMTLSATSVMPVTY